MTQSEQTSNPDREIVDVDELTSTAATSSETPGEVEIPDTSSNASQDKDEGRPLQSYFLAKRQNVVPVNNAFSDGFDPRTEIVALPSTFGEAIDQAIAKMSALDNGETTLWFEVLQQGRRMGHLPDEILPALSREGTSWTQTPEGVGGAPLTGVSLALEAGSGKNLTGERAVLTVLSHFGMGTLFRAPLWSTGIWITVKAPGEARLVEFARQFVDNKIKLGRSTYGAAFSNHMVYTAELFAQLLTECEYNGTANEKIDLIDIISVQDFMTVVWALACSIYPNGFNYRRSCVNAPDKCNHVVEQRVNVARMLRVNEKALSREQLIFMSNKKNRSVSLEEIKKYQASFAANFNHKRDLTDNQGRKMTVTFKVPTLRQFLEDGDRWVSTIANNVVEALGVDAEYDKRNAYMRDLSKVSTSRQHIHWVESISVENDVITNREPLEAIFDTVISSNDELRDQFEKAVYEFSNLTLVSVIGIPNYRCPACKGVQHQTEGAGEDEDVPAIIPVEAISTFFALVSQKVALIRERG